MQRRTRLEACPSSVDFAEVDIQSSQELKTDFPKSILIAGYRIAKTYSAMNPTWSLLAANLRPRLLGLLAVGAAHCVFTSAAQAERPHLPSRIDDFRNWMHAHRRPPKQNPALTTEESLGAALYSDRNLSLNRNQACATCHSLSPAKDAATGQPLPVAGFVDPDNVQNLTAVSKGSVPGKAGTLNTPSAGYAAFSPVFHWDDLQGLYVGGQFWNGRAATLQAQAKQPFFNPVEMAMPSVWAFVTRLKENAGYRRAFNKIFDLDLDRIPPYPLAPSTAKAPPGVTAALDAATHAIAAFEKSRAFNRFSSKFDFYLASVIELSPEEKAGLDLFVGKANCAACHVSDPTIAPDGSPLPPLFTDFTYDNIGVPRNTRIPGNPEPNPGLGGRSDVAALTPGGSEVGKHKVMPLRNIAITPPYAHNGVFGTLEEITHFYNTRDTLGTVPSDQSPGFGVTGWPAAEVPDTVNQDELGNLGLTPDEEAAVVAFMRTLTDDYPKWGNDPQVPPGTPSPFANTPFPPSP